MRAQKTAAKSGLTHGLRRAILSWLLAVTAEALLLPAENRGLDALEGLARMSMGRVCGLTLGLWILLTLAARRFHWEKLERVAIVGVFGVLALTFLRASFSWAFLIVCLLILVILLVYCVRGWDSTPEQTRAPGTEHRVWLWVTIGLSAAFFLFVGIWTVCRVYCFSTPTYDFGIFSQMFYHMKTTGLPMTTVERDGLLSHFAVHMSPIYYLLLPFYCLVPHPATLQVLQAAIITSAVIPLWKLGKLHGLKDWQRMLLCAVLLLYPAFSGGTSYDIHENCFLTPLILWLLYSIDRRSSWGTAIAAALTLMVKEDSAVYVSVAALYLVARAFLRRDHGRGWDLITGLLMLFCSLLWFFLVTGYLADNGDGVMTYRYDNFIYDGSSSLLTVVKAAIMSPMKVVYECIDTEKLRFIGLTMLPLLGLPFLTRRFERYLLLIPYVLVNLMSDYQYQHDIFFQYTFGSTAFLLYLTLVNLRDLRLDGRGALALLAAVAVSAGCFCTVVVPKAQQYPAKCIDHWDLYTQLRQTLALIPEEASVTATTFYTTFLSQRELLYDVRYTSEEHLLSTDYIVLAVSEERSYRAYGGYEELIKLLEREGYRLITQLEGVMVVYHRAD